jgi:drug/metabolite transporter (DMT)-like permease
MSLTVLVLALSSSVGWAGFDAMRKYLATRAPTVPLTCAVTGAQMIPFLAWTLLGGPWRLSAAYVVPGAVVLVLNIVANYAFVWSLSKAPLSLMIPYLSLTPVLTVGASALLLGERPTSIQTLGILLVVAGALWLALRCAGATDSSSRREVLGGSLAMALVALLWAITAPMDKIALRHATTSVHALVQTGGVSAALLGLIVYRGRGDELFELASRSKALAVATLFASVGLGLQLVAIQRTLVSLVETIKRAVGLVGSVINGRLLFAEPVTPGKLFAVSLMTVGVVLSLLEI